MDLETKKYYDQNFLEYANTTVDIDMSKLHSKFMNFLPKEADIIDLGCGSGRDLKVFKNFGFNAVGVDKTKNLVNFAKKHSQTEVICADIKKIPFHNETFDGVWACGSLVHLELKDFKLAITEIIRICKQESVIYLAVKKGEGSYRDNKGRLFFYYSLNQLNKILNIFPLDPIIVEETISKDNKTKWLNTWARVKTNDKKKKTGITIKAARQWGWMILDSNNIENSKNEIDWLLEYLLDVDKADLYKNLANNFSPELCKKFFKLISRRSQHCPFAYLVKSQFFMDLKFEVSKDVLIPRPETEILVRYIVESIDKKSKVVGFDLCAGSGCIAVSILKHLPYARMLASDISKNALLIACKNAKLHKVNDRLILVQGDLFEPFIPTESLDFIVSNPPYIGEEEYHKLMPEVRIYEPGIALLAGDGLSFYRKIFNKAANFLKPGGLLVLELGYQQLNSVKELIPCNLKIKEILKDFGKIDRVLVLSKQIKKVW